MEITININLEHEKATTLLTILKDIAAAEKDEKDRASTAPEAPLPFAPEPAPAPAPVHTPAPQPLPAPITAQPVPTPVPIPAPAPVFEATVPQYSFEDIAKAVALFIDQNKDNLSVLQRSVRDFGYNTVNEIPKDRLNEYVVVLRNLGVRI